MKNTKLTKNMKNDIAYAMYQIYRSKKMEYWWEFIPDIQSCCPVVTELLHWNADKIESHIVNSRWFRSYIRIQKFR